MFASLTVALLLLGLFWFLREAMRTAEHFAEIDRHLRQMRQGLGVCVVLCHQLRRGD